MTELVKVFKKNIGEHEVNSVNARDLHEFLELKKDFSDWIKDQIVLFKENIDYLVFPLKGENSSGQHYRPKIEYILTIEAGKHIALMSRTEKGRQIRDYFIAIEDKYKEEQKVFINQPKMRYRSLPEEIMARKSNAIKDYIDTTSALFKLDEKGTLLFAQDMYNRNKFPVPHLPQLEIKTDDDNYLYKTEIYKHFDCVKGNPKLKNIINDILVNNEKEYSKPYEYCNNGHTGGTLKYKKSILKLIEKELKK